MVAASSAGHSGAASATWEHVHRHFAVAALFVARNAAMYLFGQTIELHVDFDSTAAWRHHVPMQALLKHVQNVQKFRPAMLPERSRPVQHSWAPGVETLSAALP